MHGEGCLYREKKKADVHRKTVVKGHVVIIGGVPSESPSFISGSGVLRVSQGKEFSEPPHGKMGFR